MRGKIAVAATHKIHHPVGAGHAPPATVCYNEYNGSSVGAAYMPPVQPSGYYELPGKPPGTVKTVPYKPAGNRCFTYNRLPPGYS